MMIESFEKLKLTVQFSEIFIFFVDSLLLSAK